MPKRKRGSGYVHHKRRRQKSAKKKSISLLPDDSDIVSQTTSSVDISIVPSITNSSIGNDLEQPPLPDNKWINCIGKSKQSPQSAKTNKIGAKGTLESFNKKFTDSQTIANIKNGFVYIGQVDNVWRTNNFFVRGYKQPWHKKQRNTVEVRFSNILNVLLPSDLIGKATNKTLGIVESNAKGIPIFDSIKNSKGELQFETKDSRMPKYDLRAYYSSKNTKQNWIRLGDYMTSKEVSSTIKLCNGNYNNLPSILVVCCHYTYNKLKLKQESYDATRTFKENKELVTVLSRIETIAIKMAGIMNEALISRNFKGIRSDWGLWWKTLFDRNYKPENCSSEFENWREENIAKWEREREDEGSNAKEKIELFSNFIIMLTSQEQKDERSKRCFYEVMNGRHDAGSFLKYLECNSLHEMYDHFCGIYKPYSKLTLLTFFILLLLKFMTFFILLLLKFIYFFANLGMQTLKSEVLIKFLIQHYIMQGSEMTSKNGKLKSRHLEVFPQVESKKARVTLNSIGIVDGAGFDVHCIRLCSMLIRKVMKGNVSRSKLELWSKMIGSAMSKKSAINFNDDIGELSQQYKIAGESNVWANGVFNKLSEEDEYFADICSELKQSILTNSKF